MPQQPVVLRADGLVKRYGQTLAADDVDLEIRKGSIFGVVGPNGAGKTTTLSILTGLLRPDAGTVTVLDHDVWADPTAAKRAMGVLPDRLRLFDRLTGAQMLFYSATLRGLDGATARSRSADLAAAFGLGDALGRPVADYSVGMAKKIALAATLIHSPRVLVLDEPFESVDPVSATTITDILRRYTAGGRHRRALQPLDGTGPAHLRLRGDHRRREGLGRRHHGAGPRASQPRGHLRRTRRRPPRHGEHGMVAQLLRLRADLLAGEVRGGSPTVRGRGGRQPRRTRRRRLGRVRLRRPPRSGPRGRPRSRGPGRGRRRRRVHLRVPRRRGRGPARPATLPRARHLPPGPRRRTRPGRTPRRPGARGGGARRRPGGDVEP
ncbi:ABC transporter ATP-binding protein [Curtobacterium sp. MCJR17_043]|uniref:ABC transporter ATP-binding protein n=1 Tax=Curtobacterium sp. MCJR17_043 TaxID=2175660 RepID=UPI0032E863BE